VAFPTALPAGTQLLRISRVGRSPWWFFCDDSGRTDPILVVLPVPSCRRRGIPTRHSCRCPSNLGILRPPALTRTLLHGVVHLGLACAEATDGRRHRDRHGDTLL